MIPINLHPKIFQNNLTSRSAAVRNVQCRNATSSFAHIYAPIMELYTTEACTCHLRDIHHIETESIRKKYTSSRRRNDGIGSLLNRGFRHYHCQWQSRCRKTPTLSCGLISGETSKWQPARRKQIYYNVNVLFIMRRDTNLADGRISHVRTKRQSENKSKYKKRYGLSMKKLREKIWNLVGFAATKGV